VPQQGRRRLDAPSEEEASTPGCPARPGRALDAVASFACRPRGVTVGAEGREAADAGPRGMRATDRRRGLHPLATQPDGLRAARSGAVRETPRAPEAAAPRRFARAPRRRAAARAGECSRRRSAPRRSGSRRRRPSRP